MAEVKTTKNDADIVEFLNSVEHEGKRADSFKIVELMRKVTGLEPKMWGDSIIGFGEYHYRYASGHEGDAPQVGFSPRKQNLTLYLMGCYVDMEVCEELVEKSFEDIKNYPW